jgi:hypothetical protein
MTTLTEEARWANLRNDLVAQFETWSIPAADYRAATIVRELRRKGWRTPIPAWQRLPLAADDDVILKDNDDVNRYADDVRARSLSPERIQQHIDACRAALRSGPGD